MTQTEVATSSSQLTKTCSGCQRTLSTSLYTKKSSNKDGLEARCIECRAHDRRLSQYDLTPAQYLRLGYLQDWQCAICRTPQCELEHGLMVDHNHESGKVRALLCRACNLGLGNFYDDPHKLKRAAEYLELMEEE